MVDALIGGHNPDGSGKALKLLASEIQARSYDRGGDGKGAEKVGTYKEGENAEIIISFQHY